MSEKLLKVEGLKKYFPIKKDLLGRAGGYVQAVNGVSFYINKGEYGDMPDGLRKWLDLNAMGESLEEKYHLIRGMNGFYEVKK